MSGHTCFECSGGPGWHYATCAQLRFTAPTRSTSSQQDSAAVWAEVAVLRARIQRLEELLAAKKEEKP